MCYANACVKRAIESKHLKRKNTKVECCLSLFLANIVLYHLYICYGPIILTYSNLLTQIGYCTCGPREVLLYKLGKHNTVEHSGTIKSVFLKTMSDNRRPQIALTLNQEPRTGLDQNDFKYILGVTRQKILDARNFVGLSLLVLINKGSDTDQVFFYVTLSLLNAISPGYTNLALMYEICIHC